MGAGGGVLSSTERGGRASCSTTSPASHSRTHSTPSSTDPASPSPPPGTPHHMLSMGYRSPTPQLCTPQHPTSIAIPVGTTASRIPWHPQHHTPTPPPASHAVLRVSCPTPPPPTQSKEGGGATNTGDPLRSPCPPSIGHRAHLLAARGLVRGGDTLQLSLWISVPPNPPHSHTHPPLLIPIGASRRWAPRRAQGGTGGGHRGGHSPTPGITPPGAVQNRSALCREVGAGTGFNPQRAVSPRPQGTDAVCGVGGARGLPPHTHVVVEGFGLTRVLTRLTAVGGCAVKVPEDAAGGGRKASEPPPLSPHPPTALSPIPGLWGGGRGLSLAAVEALMRSGCGAGGGTGLGS